MIPSTASLMAETIEGKIPTTVVAMNNVANKSPELSIPAAAAAALGWAPAAGFAGTALIFSTYAVTPAICTRLDILLQVLS